MATKNIGGADRVFNAEVPDEGETKDVRLTASTKVKVNGDKGNGETEKKAEDFLSPFPKTLADAIAIEGVSDVFKRYCSSLAIERQGEKRKELTPSDAKAPRKKAAWLDDLDL